VLLILYTAGWVSLLLGTGSGVDSEAQDVTDDVGGPTYYEVKTASGEVHILRGDPSDPAGVLLEAGQRFGEVASVKRIDRRVAEQIETQQTSSHLRKALGLLLLLPLAMLLAGIWLRRRTYQTHLVWEAIRRTLGMDAVRLAEATGLSDGALRSAIEGINRRRLAHLEWDADSNRIADIRLSDHSLTVEYCQRCHEPLNQRMLADLKQIPRCTECVFQHDIAYLDGLKAPIVERLHEEAAQARKSAGAERFSLFTFSLLALVFPPGAIAYAVRQW
jgi:hypothetical protein